MRSIALSLALALAAIFSALRTTAQSTDHCTYVVNVDVTAMYEDAYPELSGLLPSDIYSGCMCQDNQLPSQCLLLLPG